MGQFVFGAGNVLAIPSGAAQTPIAFGTLQDVSVDFSFTNKELTGQYQYPVAVGRGPAKVSGKAKAATFSANFFNQAFFGVTPVAGSTLTNINFAASVPGSGPFTITIVPPASGVFLDDGSVIDATTGVALTRVASAPSTGAYSVTGAVYTFASSDLNRAVLITYTYTVTTGYSALLSNQLMGSAPTFKLVLSNSYNNAQLTLELYQVISDKLMLAFKNTDWSVPEFDFSCFTNAANNLGKLSLTTF